MKPLDYNKLHDLTTQMKAHQQAIDDCQRQIKKLLGLDGEEPAAEPKKRGRPKMTRAAGLRPGADPGISEEIVTAHAGQQGDDDRPSLAVLPVFRGAEGRGGG